MKQTVQLQRIQERMAPGVVSRDGFLGTDPRPLIDILLADEGEVNRLGLDHRYIADRMMDLRAAGATGLGAAVDVAPHFVVRVQEFRGSHACPFGDPGMFPISTTTVRNTRLGREVAFTDLGIHLVSSHGFYEGRGSPFRLEPAELAEVLEIRATGG